MPYRWKRSPPKTQEERYWEKVDKAAGPDGCWPWLGAINCSRSTPHGVFWADGKQINAHRYGLILSGVELLPGHVVDHMCRNSICQNPTHLRQVTPRVNALENNDNPLAKNAQKTQCVHGHMFAPENTARIPSSRGKGTSRICLTCHPRTGARGPHRARNPKTEQEMP